VKKKFEILSNDSTKDYNFLSVNAPVFRKQFERKKSFLLCHTFKKDSNEMKKPQQNFFPNQQNNHQPKNAYNYLADLR